jgi:NO-binding membrane sensor protein with MHYT domain
MPVDAAPLGASFARYYVTDFTMGFILAVIRSANALQEVLDVFIVERPSRVGKGAVRIVSIAKHHYKGFAASGLFGHCTGHPVVLSGGDAVVTVAASYRLAAELEGFGTHGL